MATDILVRAEGRNPKALDITLRNLPGAGACLIGGPDETYFTVLENGVNCFVVRCLGNAGFAKFAMENQGYAEVIRICDGLYNE